MILCPRLIIAGAIASHALPCCGLVTCYFSQRQQDLQAPAVGWLLLVKLGWVDANNGGCIYLDNCAHNQHRHTGRRAYSKKTPFDSFSRDVGVESTAVHDGYADIVQETAIVVAYR